ncbi:alpha-(1,3)-fucosyltransferase 9-like [Gadus morhua]|uniref:Fucosyltransferase n=1 Tax=Gadus morhua TaxID=8049 RepID=A0A8C5CAX3_GADMO|nr:alpha-(1,3)-fucosyltransferase 9-like [Gadus morhua]XP_030234098.1 alpha-(1,3)-fucosyltransferase 9-like [Gadus morhua]
MTWSQNVFAAALILGTTTYVYLLYIQPSPMHNCSSDKRLFANYTSVVREETPKKPLVLIWAIPYEIKFDPNDCKKYYNISGCDLTYDRSLYQQADAVMFYHKSIRNVDHMPQGPRPQRQKWIWYNVESPSNTQEIPGIYNKFNLTLSYRRDAGITARYEVAIKDEPDDNFVLPKKDRLVCWIVSNMWSDGTQVRNAYYKELAKHIKVDVFGLGFSAELPPESYYPTLQSCKFYLAFENSAHKDYMTEKMNGPLSSGTVPIVLGIPRDNYEEFVPSDSFIHVNDFPNAKAMAQHLLELDKNDEKYMKYFAWRRFYTATPHLLTLANEFTLPTCFACDHISRDNRYSVVHNLFRWAFSSR